MLRSALATSSRVGLDFFAPTAGVSVASRRITTSAPAAVGAGFGARAASKAKRNAEVPLRWQPLDPSPYRRANGQVDRAPTHQLSIKSSRNNVLLTFSDAVGPLFPTITGGTDKTFKKAQRSSYEAAHQAALKMISKVHAYEQEVRAARPADRIWIKVAYKGLFGQGREAVHTALAGPDGADVRPLISRVEDHTPFKIGGTRPRSPRRV